MSSSSSVRSTLPSFMLTRVNFLRVRATSPRSSGFGIPKGAAGVIIAAARGEGLKVIPSNAQISGFNRCLTRFALSKRGKVGTSQGGSWVPDPSRLPSIVPTAICCMGIDSKKTVVRGPLRPYYQYGVVRFTSLFSHTPPQLGRCLMSMSNTMICGATKIWYYVPEKSSGAFEAWLDATRPGYIENLEAGTHSFVPSLSPEEMAKLDIKRVPQNAGETVEMQGCSWRWSLSTGFSISEEACNWFTEEVCTPEALKSLYKKWQMYVAKQKISRDRADELLEMASHVYGCLKTV
ncbi:hypothetical protein WJX77_010245 [Trebouxia sp. C0004]